MSEADFRFPKTGLKKVSGAYKEVEMVSLTFLWGRRER